jgi:hypothetical protein
MLRLGKLTERLPFKVVSTIPAIRNRLPVAHGRSLARSVRPDRTQRGRAVIDGASACAPLLSDSVVSTTARSARTGAPEDQGEREGVARGREHLVKQLSALPTAGLASPTDPTQYGDEQDTKPCSRPVWWAREELNLRPLPCQQTPETAVLTGVLPGHLRP